MAATTAAAIDAAAVDPSPGGDGGGGGAGADGRGGGADVAWGRNVVLDADAGGALAARPDGRVVFGGPGGLTRDEVAWVDGAPWRDEPVTGAAALGTAALDVAGWAFRCGLV